MQHAITVKMANEQLRSSDEYISSTTWVMSDCDLLADLKILQTSALQLHAIEEVWDLLTPTEEVDVFSETNDQLLMVLSSSAGSSTKTATTLQLQGHIQHQDSLVLIESGSFHIFLSDRLRSELSAVQPLVTPLTVQMASDQVITCCHHLPSNEWMMSGCYFSAARKFLLIPSFDLVVGRIGSNLTCLLRTTPATSQLWATLLLLVNQNNFLVFLWDPGGHVKHSLGASCISRSGECQQRPGIRKPVILPAATMEIKPTCLNGEAARKAIASAEAKQLASKWADWVVYLEPGGPTVEPGGPTV